MHIHLLFYGDLSPYANEKQDAHYHKHQVQYLSFLHQVLKSLSTTPIKYFQQYKFFLFTIVSVKKDDVDDVNEVLEEVVVEREVEAPVSNVNNEKTRTIEDSSPEIVSPIEQIYQQRRKQRHF